MVQKQTTPAANHLRCRRYFWQKLSQKSEIILRFTIHINECIKSCSLRPSGREIGIHKAVDDCAADTSLRTRRIFNAGVIFRTVSVPHLVVRVYHVSAQIEVVGDSGM